MSDSKDKSKKDPTGSEDSKTAPAAREQWDFFALEEEEARSKPKYAKYSSGQRHSMADLDIPNAELIDAFQPEEGEEIIINVGDGPKMSVRPSYADGLFAIKTSGLPQDLEDQLQVDHSRAYMERKFREWQETQRADSGGSSDEGSGLDPAELLASSGLECPTDAAGTFQAITPELLAASAAGDTQQSGEGSRLSDAAKTGDPKIDLIEQRRSWPYAGREFYGLSLCSRGSPSAWIDAYQSYASVRELFTRREGTALLKALVLNEIHLYEIQDEERDAEAAHSLISPSSLEPLGLAQMTPKVVYELEEGLYAGRPMREKDGLLRNYLRSLGYKGDGHEAMALLDPRCIPWIVAARLDTLIIYLSRARDRVTQSGWINLSLPVVAYSFNPDVFYNPVDYENPDFHPVYRNEYYFERARGYQKAYPTAAEEALSVSRHLDNVLYWLGRLSKKSP